MEKYIIDIYIGNMIYASRYWSTVPRIGDLVEITYNGDYAQALIKKILWRGGREGSIPSVRLFCEIAS